MLSDIDILKEMIKSPPLEVQGGSIELVEESDDNDYTVTITNAPTDCVVIKADSFEMLGINNQDKILIGTNHSRKKADYIIICESGGKKHIFYIELKFGGGSDSVVNKLKGAKCYMHYFSALAREFWGKKASNKGNILNIDGYESRYIVFFHIKGRKLGSRAKGSGLEQRKNVTGKSPEDCFRFKWQKRIRFENLLNP